MAETARRARTTPEGPELVEAAGAFLAREGRSGGLCALVSFEAFDAEGPDVVLLLLRVCASGSSAGDPARLKEVRIGDGGRSADTITGGG